MAYKRGDRYQVNMFPPTYDELISQTDPARIYDEFVECLDTRELELKIDANKVGHPEYDPKVMLKLILYGCSYGIRSSRKLEQACHHNITFIWLTRGFKPDYRTIARFRKRNSKILKNVFKLCARLCLRLGVIEGNTLFVDGTKMRANAAIKNTRGKATYTQALAQLDHRVNDLLKQWERTDTAESDQGSFVALRKDLHDAQQRQGKIKAMLGEMEEECRESANSTDPDCVKVKGRQGIHAGYNGQIVADDKHGLILSCDVVSESNDSSQFARQINIANRLSGKPCKTAVADAGYADASTLAEIYQQDIEVIVPVVVRDPKKEGPFSKEYFRYDATNNCYICPEGQTLSYQGRNPQKRQHLYRIKNPKICHICKHFGSCTQGKRGRTIKRLYHEDINEQIKTHCATHAAQQTFRRRKHRAEKPFGYMKRTLGADHFLLRGLNLVNAEFAMLATCYNIRRIMTIFNGKNPFPAAI